jgi:hypothetical protein
MGLGSEVGGFFKSLIHSNNDAGVLSNLFVEKGLTKKTEETIATNLNKKTAKEIQEKAANESYDYVQGVNDMTENTTKAAKEMGSATEIKTGRTGKADDAVKNAAAFKAGEGATQEEYDKALKSVNSTANRQAAWENVKGYYKDPWKRMTDQTLSKEERNLAMAQFGARAGATAGGMALVGGIGHDLMSDNEDDIGVGGVIGNTVGATALTAGAAAGIGMLRKL